jgi:two-component system CheB/CheR fusion protein
LVVEDNEDSATSQALLLGLEGHRVTLAADGPTALREVQRACPDMVLLDIGLPGMDGYEVARRVHEMQLWKRPLLVAVTAWGEEADRRRSAEVGIDLHLVKPVDPQTLIALLRRFRSVLY